MIASVPVIERRPEFSDVLKENHQFARGTGDGPGETVNSWFDSLMLQSGIRTSPGVWLGLCLVCGLGFGGFSWLALERPLLSGCLAPVGMLIPVISAAILRSRRQQAILKQLPAMAEELARSARAGQNLEQAFRIVAADTPLPLGEELRICARRMDMGLDVGGAVRDLAPRTGVATLTMLTSALTVHQDTGGDLVAVLERLAAAVRDRLHFVSRQRAATIAARMGAIMMVIIPIGVVSFYLFRDPNYLNSLLASFWGRLSLWTAIGLQIVGGVTVIRILNRSARF